jgi:hypothetical protein
MPADVRRVGVGACAPDLVPESVILKKLVSAGFAVSAVKRDLDRSVIRQGERRSISQ